MRSSLESVQKNIVRLSLHQLMEYSLRHFWSDIFAPKAKVDNQTSNNYWSSTTNVNNTSNSWNDNFNNGNSNNNNKNNLNYVRCVRSG